MKEDVGKMINLLGVSVAISALTVALQFFVWLNTEDPV